MDKKLVKPLVKYLIAFAVGGAMTLGVLFSQGYFHQTELLQKYKNLCDAFTIPGVVLMLVTALLAVSNGGIFDGLSYSLGRLFRMLIPFMNKSDETYAEYKERKHGGGKLRGYSFLFFTGLAFFAAAIVFLVLFYKVY